jgi:hypothetical protein
MKRFLLIFSVLMCFSQSARAMEPFLIDPVFEAERGLIISKVVANAVGVATLALSIVTGMVYLFSGDYSCENPRFPVLCDSGTLIRSYSCHREYCLFWDALKGEAISPTRSISENYRWVSIGSFATSIFSAFIYCGLSDYLRLLRRARAAVPV